MLRLKSDQPALMQAIGAEFDGDEADNDTSRKLRSSTTAGKGSITPRNTDHHGGPPLRQSSNGSGQACRRSDRAVATANCLTAQSRLICVLHQQPGSEGEGTRPPFADSLEC